jgi:hypothetical protein
MSRRELFELMLSGGPSERLYRRVRPEIDRLPWGEPLGVRVTKAERLAARREWTVAALQEYRAASAQAAVLAALVRARVPLDLSALAARFPCDELAHAEICARVANELGGGAPVSFDPVQAFARPVARDRPPLVAACVLVARLYGVGEGWSFGFLDGLRRDAQVPLLRAVWRALARDEAVHARFAWMFFEWARTELDEGAWLEVQAAARAGVVVLVQGWRNAAALPRESFSAIGPLGRGGHTAYLERAHRALQENVIEPFSRFGIDAAPDPDLTSQEGL